MQVAHPEMHAWQRGSTPLSKKLSLQMQRLEALYLLGSAMQVWQEDAEEHVSQPLGHY